MKTPWQKNNPFVFLLRLLPHLPNFARLFWRLCRDPRVPLRLKAMVVAAVLYVLLPIDVLPDFIPVLGQLDDFMLLVFSVYYFIQWSPEAVVAEHVAAIDERLGTKIQP
ncbi:hypothetical protein NKDENANG_01228 [Candidatus Entotheonellaceae bacterium PAL068K]